MSPKATIGELQRRGQKMTEESLSSHHELRVDAPYQDRANWRLEGDEFNKFFRFPGWKSIATQQGFRPMAVQGRTTVITDCGFCLFVTTLEHPAWPDRLEHDAG